MISNNYRNHLEENPPKIGFASLLDPESGATLEGNFNKASVNEYSRKVHAHDHKLYETFRKDQVKFTKVYTDSIAGVELRRLFEGR